MNRGYPCHCGMCLWKNKDNQDHAWFLECDELASGWKRPTAAQRLADTARAYIPDDKVERKEQPFTRAFPLHDPVLHHLAKKYHTGLLVRGDFNAPELAIRSR